MRLKNTNNHALKYWPFYEGEGLTSGFMKKKKKRLPVIEITLWLNISSLFYVRTYLISKEKAYNLKSDRIHILKTVRFLTEDIHVTRICKNFREDF